MENLLQRKGNSKYKIFKQDNDHEHDLVTPKGEEAKFGCEDGSHLETEEMTTAETHGQRLKMNEQTEVRGTSVSKIEEEGLLSHIDSSMCDNHSRQTMNSGKLHENKPAPETTNNDSGLLYVPKVMYEEITDSEDFDLASDEEIPNKISEKQYKKNDVACSNVDLLKQNSDSESAASTDVEYFSNNRDIEMSTFVKPKKSFCPFVIMNDKDNDDLEDVFLPDTSKHVSSFQKFISKQSSFTGKIFDGNILSDTETIEIKANETLPQFGFKTGHNSSVVHSVDSQQTKLHKHQLTYSSDKNYHPKTINDITHHTTLDRTRERGGAAYITDSQTSYTEMEEILKCSCDEQCSKIGKAYQSQEKFKALSENTVLRASPDPDTEVEDLSDSNAMETRMTFPFLNVTSDPVTDVEEVNDSITLAIDDNKHELKQQMECRFNKQCYDDNNSCVEKNKFYLQHKSSLISFTKCSENLSALESALTDVEELDMSEDDSNTGNIYNSYKSLPLSSKGDKGSKKLTKAVIPKAMASHNTLSGIITDDAPLTDTEDLYLSDIDTTNVDISKNFSSDAFYPWGEHNLKK